MGFFPGRGMFIVRNRVELAGNRVEASLSVLYCTQFCTIYIYPVFPIGRRLLLEVHNETEIMATSYALQLYTAVLHCKPVWNIYCTGLVGFDQ